MSIIIRLQNLPWAADSVDIRRYFTGLSIPEGGVHIVGGEMGDAFIAFSTDEDARLAMAKDGGKIHEMQIKLLLSSRTEMMRVIEKARQLNLALQAQAVPVAPLPLPTPVLPTPVPTQQQQPPARVPAEDDRRRGQSPHRRSSRDKSPPSRRRGPDSRRSSSKRERSRSPARGGSSRGGSGNRDTDRRDRSKRDDRRHDDSRNRSREDSKKYPETDSFGRQPRSNSASDGYRESNNNNRYNEAPASHVSSYSYDATPSAESLKGLPAAFYPQPSNPIHPSDPFAVGKQVDSTVVSSSSTSVYMQQPNAYGAAPYGQPMPPIKELSVTSKSDPMNQRSRFEPDYSHSQDASYYSSPNINAKVSMPEISYGDKRPAPQDFHSQNRNTWSSTADVHGKNWQEKHPGILEPPLTKNGDFIHPIPMDLEQSPPPEIPPNKNIFNHSQQYSAPRNMPIRGNDMHHEKHWQATPSLCVVITGIPPDARIEEVQEIFRNIHIFPSNICIEVNAQGGAEKAFIRFSKNTEFQEAVNGHPRYIRNYRCDIIPCPDAVFEAAFAAPKAIKPRPKPRPKESDLCVQLRGLPYSSKEPEIQRFFEGLKITEITVELSSEGRSVGIAFVQFATERDFRMALTMNGKMIGHRFITISVASKDHIMVARGTDYTQNLQPKAPLIADFDIRNPQHLPGPPIEQPAPPALPRLTNFCISMKGMPTTVTNQNIVEFFGELSVTIRAIHLMLGPDKRPSGEAFVEFGTKAEASAALNMNNMVLLGSRIFISPISFDEMTVILNIPKALQALPPPPGPGPLLKTPLVASPDKLRRPLIDVPPVQKDFVEPHSNNIKNERPPFDRPVNDQQHFGHSTNERPHFDQPREQFPPHERSRPDYPRSDRHPSDYPHGERPPHRSDRPHSDHRHSERSSSEFPRNERPPSEFSRGERSSDFPRGERSPRGDRPHSDYPRGDRPPSDFPRGDRPPSDFPRGDRPPRGERPPRGDFPRSERPPPPDFPHGEPSEEFLHHDGPPAEFQGGPPSSDYPRGRPRPNFRGDYPRPNFPRGERPPHMDYSPRGERPRFEPRFRGGGRPPHMRPPFGRGMRPPFSSRPGGPPQDHSSPTGFGAPGCVVSINNLHYDAGLEELYEFFKDYMLTKDNIIRRFDESGRATAEARVSFQCPADAQRAVRELNKKTIMGRCLFLSLI